MLSVLKLDSLLLSQTPAGDVRAAGEGLGTASNVLASNANGNEQAATLATAGTLASQQSAASTNGGTGVNINVGAELSKGRSWWKATLVESLVLTLPFVPCVSQLQEQKQTRPLTTGWQMSCRLKGNKLLMPSGTV